MKCDDCGKNKSVYFIHKNINGEKKDIFLCRDCAEKRGLVSLPSMNEMHVPEIVSKLLNISSINELSTKKSICNNCGLSFENFIKIGRLGCENCYDAFGKELEKILRKLHGSIKHRGMFPTISNIENIEEEINNLKRELEKAIKNEEYEKAAEIRDRIKILSKTLKI